MALTASKFFFDSAGQGSPEEEARFFRSLKVRNRNSKQTEKGRLDRLNEIAVDLLSAPHRRIAAALDIGISSGVTTAELYDSLRKAGLSPSLVATDLSIYATIVEVSPKVRVLIDSAGDILQYDVAGFAMRPWRRRLDHFTGMSLVKAAIEGRYASAARRALASGDTSSQRVALITPPLTANPDVLVCEDDLLKPNPGFAHRFDFIRAANVLNREYFNEATLKAAISTLASYLSGPGALLLIVRTDERTGHHGAFYELQTDGRLAAVRVIGGGSELAALIDMARSAP